MESNAAICCPFDAGDFLALSLAAGSDRLGFPDLEGSSYLPRSS